MKYSCKSHGNDKTKCKFHKGPKLVKKVILHTHTQPYMKDLIMIFILMNTYQLYFCYAVHISYFADKSVSDIQICKESEYYKHSNSGVLYNR